MDSVVRLVHDLPDWSSCEHLKGKTEALDGSADRAKRRRKPGCVAQGDDRWSPDDRHQAEGDAAADGVASLCSGSWWDRDNAGRKTARLGRSVIVVSTCCLTDRA